MSILCFGESYLPTGFTSHPATYQAVPTVFQLLLWLMSFPIESGPCTELKLWRYDLCPRVHTNDYSTYLCTVDGVAVPQQPFAIATVFCKWLLQNSYAIYCTQAGRVIIGAHSSSSLQSHYIYIICFSTQILTPRPTSAMKCGKRD